MTVGGMGSNSLMLIDDDDDDDESSCGPPSWLGWRQQRTCVTSTLKWLWNAGGSVTAGQGQ